MKKIGLLLCLCCWMSTPLWGQQVETYEYWLDTDDMRKVTGTVPTDGSVRFSLDVSGLNEGMHLLIFRTKDSEGQWSSPLSSYFYHSANEGNEIVAYEYWFDSNDADKQEGNCNGLLSAGLDVSGLSEGIHSLYIRFLDRGGRWSPTTTHNFYCSSSTTGIEPIEANEADNVNSFTMPVGAREGTYRLYDLRGRLRDVAPVLDLSAGKKDLRPYYETLSAGNYILRIEVRTAEATVAIHKKLSIQ